MSDKVVLPWPASPMDNVRGQNSELCLSDIIQNLAAFNAAAFGHLVGGDTIQALVPNVAPKNPTNGIRGHDHSGGQFGKGFGVDVFHWTTDSCRVHSSNIATNEIVSQHKLDYTPDSADDSGDYKATIMTCPVDVPGCDPLNGVYNQLGVALTYNISTSTNITATELFIRLVNRHPLMNATRTFTCNGSATGLQTELSLDTATQPLLPVVPGDLNVIDVILFLDVDDTNDKVLELEILELAFGVYEI